MAERGESSGRGSQFNIATIIALLTAAAGILVVSKKLTSDRPLSSSERPVNPKEDQTVEARLWEDPFKWKPEEAQATNYEAFALLQTQIVVHAQSSPPYILAVMVGGGTYSEDIEGRIRSRFAIVSALEEAHYKPESAEHLGAVLLPSPSARPLLSWLKDTNSAFQIADDEFDDRTNVLKCDDRLPLSFEWYRRTEFLPSDGRISPAPPFALVLWLDEDRFMDNLEVRLALLLRRLAGVGATNRLAAQTNLLGRIALIGPRTSDALEQMLMPYEGGTNGPRWTTPVGIETSNTLSQIDVYCATPAVMDEMLVSQESRNNIAGPDQSSQTLKVQAVRLKRLQTRDSPAIAYSDYFQRRVVQIALENHGFHSFHNYAATDAQLARQALDELKLRGVDLAHTNKNLVLISEWDTFYGRALLLTFSAELGLLQGSAANRYEFVEQYRQKGIEARPRNLFPYVYLRGLDGQTTKPARSDSPSADRSGGISEANASTHFSLNDFKHWSPDDNAAFGSAQFDYLARLGQRIQDLQNDLKIKGRGRIDAIGIAGSDVYDILLILQALRSRFPEAIFFTTDLDARLWHPKELAWSRNLVVISGYGLQLESKLQGRIAPFRDSSQTAQFAAALAALGNTNAPLGSANSPMWTRMEPRRFEIGRSGPYDLSVTDRAPLHPPPPVLRGIPWRQIVLSLLVVITALLFASLFVAPLRRLTWDCDHLKVVNPGARHIGGEEESRIESFTMMRNQRRLLWAGVIVAVLLLLVVLYYGLAATFSHAGGEPFLVGAGLSIWPTEVLRLLALWLSFLFICTTYATTKTGIFKIISDYKLPFTRKRKYGRQYVLPPQNPGDAVDASELWERFQHLSQISPRLQRTILPFVLYGIFGFLLFKMGGFPNTPARGDAAFLIDHVVLLLTIIVFLFLTFWVMDSVRLCSWLIEQISEPHTTYPKACLDRFGRQWGLEEQTSLLAEWIDLKLIAEVTSHAGRSVYYPFVVLLLLLISRNRFWDNWTWPPDLIVIFTLNGLLIAGSVIMLQRAARKAQQIGISRLKEKAEQAARKSAKNLAEHQASKAQKLLDEVQHLNTGAFAPFWENPLVGAILIPSGGTAFLEVLFYLFS